MDKLKELAGLRLIHPTARTRLRQVRPSQWDAEGLKLPKSGKWMSFWVTHMDLITWAGGLKTLQRRFTYSVDVYEYLWGLYDREVGHVYGYFVEVMEPNTVRMSEWCDAHFENREISTN